MDGKVARYRSFGWDSTQLRGVEHTPEDFAGNKIGVEYVTDQYVPYDVVLVKVGAN